MDEFVELDTELAPFKKKIYRRDTLRKEIAARYENEPETESFIAPGIFTAGVEVGPKTMRRDFKRGALEILASILGKPFWKLISMRMEDFDNHVTIDQRDKYVAQSQSGYRYVHAIAGEVRKAA